MNLPSQPSDYHSDLSEDRLLALAQFFASTRSATAALHDPLSGDDNWTLGCRGFARCKNLLMKKAQLGEWSWLRVLNPGKKFMFAVGAVPVRFYRGQHTNPPSRTLAYNPQELSQLSFAFPNAGGAHGDLKWRFAIETNSSGEPVSVTFAGLAGDDGSVVCHWKLPFDLHDLDFDLDSPDSEDMVELPPPSVTGPTVRHDTSHGK